MNVLVTGAGGFVGQAYCEYAQRHGAAVRRVLRRPQDGATSEGAELRYADIGATTDFSPLLDGIDAIVHLAGVAHRTQGQLPSEYHAGNVVPTAALARAAVAAGVRRFVFVSSIKVNGESTHGAPFRETDEPCPQDAYGRSKWEAEQTLWRIAAESSLEAVVLRPPLIYGPGVKANFLKLISLADAGMPLPLASVDNRRSLLYVSNFAAAIHACVTAANAAGKTYLVADDAGISTTALISAIAAALDRRARLVPFPIALLRLAGAVAGKSAQVSRLVGSLEVDSSKIRSELGWQPRYSTVDGVQETARWYRLQHPRAG